MKKRKMDYSLLLLIIISHLQYSQGSSLLSDNLKSPEIFVNTPSHVLAQVIVKTTTLPIPKTTIPVIKESNKKYVLIFNNFLSTDIKKLLFPPTTFPKNLEKNILNQISSYFGLKPIRFKDLKFQPNKEERVAMSFTLTAGTSIFNSIQGAHRDYEKERKLVKIEIKTINTTVVLEHLFSECNWDEDSRVEYDVSCKVADTPGTSPLLALIAIPIILFLIILILVLVWYFKYKRPKDNSNVTLNELGYVENVSKFGGTISTNKNPGTTLSIANSTVRNQVYTTMGKSYGFSVDDADFSTENIDEVN